MATATFIERQTYKHEPATDWYVVDGKEYGLTDDNRIIDSDGCPLTTGDDEEVKVRRAIEAAQK